MVQICSKNYKKEHCLVKKNSLFINFEFIWFPKSINFINGWYLPNTKYVLQADYFYFNLLKLIYLSVPSNFLFFLSNHQLFNEILKPLKVILIFLYEIHSIPFLSNFSYQSPFIATFIYTNDFHQLK